jgi:cell division protein FtsL
VKKRRSSFGLVALMVVIVFILLFTYSSLNLKNLAYGYRMQELVNVESKLEEEIDKLEAEKAILLNLKRIEKIVTKRLGYQYPQSHQFIRVFEN